MNKYSKNKTGGKFLGEGQYGCVYSPPIPCKIERYDTYFNAKSVGKIIDNSAAGKMEIKISKFFSELDPNGKYINPFLGNCRITKNALLKSDNDLTKCKLTRDHVETQPEKKTESKMKGYLNKMKGKFEKKPPEIPEKIYTQIVYKYKGDDLLNFLKEQNKNLPLSFYISGLLNIAKGIQLLEKKHYAHTDIKPDNILVADVEKQQQQMLLIDLGLADKLENIYDIDLSWNKLEHTSTHSPPEFQIYTFFVKMIKDGTLKQVINYLGTVENNKLKGSIEDIISNEPFNLYKNMFGQKIHVNRNTYWNKNYKTSFSIEIQEHMEHILSTIFLNSKKLNNDDEYLLFLYRYFTTNYSKLIDVFQLGDVINDILKFYPLKSDTNHNKLRYLATRMYNFNPTKRLTIREVINELNNIKKDNIQPINKDSPPFNKYSPPTKKSSSYSNNNLYKILDTNMNSSLGTIKRQYKKLALKYHPDKVNNDDGKKFIKIADAYNILSDDNKRRIYDRDLLLNNTQNDKYKWSSSQKSSSKSSSNLSNTSSGPGFNWPSSKKSSNNSYTKSSY